MTVITIPYRPRKFQRACHAAIETHRFSVIVAHRGFGKTVLAVNHLIKMAAIKKGVYGYLAPLRKQAKIIAWDYLKFYTAPIPGADKNESDLVITLPNGSKIGVYGADDPDSLRGIHWDGVVLDEVAQMRPQTWGEIIRPGLSAKNGWILFIGTPKGQNLFYDLYQQSLHTEGWHSSVFTATDTQIFPIEELELARKSLSAAQYAQEYECDFSAACENSLIRLDVVQAAVERKYNNHIIESWEKVIGVDIARFGDDKTVIAIRQGRVLYPLIKIVGLQNETTALAGRIAQEIKTHKPAQVCIDAGYNPGVIDVLKGWNYKINEINFGGKPSDDFYLNKRANMWADMRDWLPLASIPNDNELKGDLIAPTYDFGGAGGKFRLESKEKMKERGLPSPNCGDATALTFACPIGSLTTRKTQTPEIGVDVGKAWSPFDYTR